jgi:hypothetical protein
MDKQKEVLLDAVSFKMLRVHYESESLVRQIETGAEGFVPLELGSLTDTELATMHNELMDAYMTICKIKRTINGLEQNK